MDKEPGWVKFRRIDGRVFLADLGDVAHGRDSIKSWPASCK